MLIPLYRYLPAFKNLMSLRISHRMRARRRNSGLTLLQTLEPRQLLTVSGLQAVHRSGQTFVTWQEDSTVTGELYHVYRSSSPITSQNLASAQRLTSKWGPLDDNTSVHQLAGSHSPSTFVIQDLGSPLSEDTGLFVYTTPSGQSGSFYYAVTEVVNGVEQVTVSSGSSSLALPLNESVATPQPVLIYSANGGKSRVYTQYMDYAKWNPTFNGYAYNYSVALPYNYNPATSYPVKVMPHAYGERYYVVPEAEYQWPLIEVFVDDPGGDAGTVSTWWYGFAADHNYKTQGPIPTSGRVENFTEQRVLKAVDEVISNFNVDLNGIHVEGHSMGASGALSLGMRYGNLLAGTFSSEPMTNYASSPLFQQDFERLWGTQQSNLPVVNNGPYATQLTKYNNMGVYNWMNHHEQIVARRGDDMAFLMIGHGKADDVIDWQTQGREFIQYLNQAHVGFTAEQRFGWDHNFMSFDFVNVPMFSTGDGGLGEWVFKANHSLLSFVNATGSGPNYPGPGGTDFYNRKIDWSVPWNNFHAPVVDNSTHYEVSIRSQDGNQTADVTPRNFQRFVTAPGMSVQWSNVQNSTGQIVQSGTVTADSAGLVIIPGFQIGTGIGNRLIMDAIVTAPVITTSPGATYDSTPLIEWSSVPASNGYQIWIDNVSTGQKPIINTVVYSSSYEPAVAWGIGLYRIWARAAKISGGYTGWSSPVDIHVKQTTAFPALPTWVDNARPNITWNAIPGAVKYDMWITNNTTGQSPAIRQPNLSTNSYQVPADLPLGRYTIWVQSIDASGRSAGWSFGRVFNIATKTLTLGPEGNSIQSTPTFRWNPVTGAATYGVFIRNVGTGVLQADVTGIVGTNWTPPSALSMGDNRWWVRAFAVNGQAGIWSDPKVVSIKSPPVILTFPGTTSDRTPTFSWTSVLGAARYELWVARNDGGGVVINLTNLSTTSYTPSSNLAPGPYRIWVRAVSASNVHSSWSSAVDISIVDTKGLALVGNLLTGISVATDIPGPVVLIDISNETKRETIGWRRIEVSNVKDQGTGVNDEPEATRVDCGAMPAGPQ